MGSFTVQDGGGNSCLAVAETAIARAYLAMLEDLKPLRFETGAQEAGQSAVVHAAAGERNLSDSSSDGGLCAARINALAIAAWKRAAISARGTPATRSATIARQRPLTRSERARACSSRLHAFRPRIGLECAVRGVNRRRFLRVQWPPAHRKSTLRRLRITAAAASKRRPRLDVSGALISRSIMRDITRASCCVAPTSFLASSS